MSAIKTLFSTDFLMGILYTGGGLSVLILILMIIFHSIARFFRR